MKKIVKNLMLLVCLVFGLKIIAQNHIENNFEKPFIEVYGTADKEIAPNEIYIEIRIKERENGRNKININEQEITLRARLKSLGIAEENLTLSDAQANYGYVKTFKKGVTTQKLYELKLNSVEMLSKVFEMLDDIHIEDAEVIRVDHSEMDEYRKETRIAAIKKAKDTADYLLEAIGEKRGKALEIKENKFIPNLDGKAIQKLSTLQWNPDGYGSESIPMSFTKMTIGFSYFIRYEIK